MADRILTPGHLELIVNNPKTIRVLFVIDNSILPPPPDDGVDPISQLLDELHVIIHETSLNDTLAMIDDRHAETPKKRLLLICGGFPVDFYHHLDHVEEIEFINDFPRMHTVLQWFRTLKLGD